MSSVETIIKNFLVDKKEYFYLGCGITPGVLENAFEHLDKNISATDLPADYKLFLEKFGVLFGQGIELCGARKQSAEDQLTEIINEQLGFQKCFDKEIEDITSCWLIGYNFEECNRFYMNVSSKGDGRIFSIDNEGKINYHARNYLNFIQQFFDYFNYSCKELISYRDEFEYTEPEEEKKNGINEIKKMEQLRLFPTFAPSLQGKPVLQKSGVDFKNASGCKALEPEYAKATTVNEKSELLLAKLDTAIETELAEQHEVCDKLSKKRKLLDYTDRRVVHDIIRWLKKETGPAVTDLTTVDAAKAFVESEDVVVIGFFENQDGPEVKVFMNVATEMNDFAFGITFDDAVYTELKATKDSIILFKKFDEGRNEYDGEPKEDDLKRFLKTNSLPVVIEFSLETAQEIFGGDIKAHNLLFISKSSSEYESKLKDFHSVAKEYKNKVLFVTINIDVEDHERIMEFFRLKKEEAPTMRIIKLEDEITKFKPLTNGITAEDIKGFVNGVLEGKIKVEDEEEEKGDSKAKIDEL